ncbi:exonuclease domain-containing protein [Aureicoccus marinus]|uniref:GIY-YIG domain-containing protein n=1 Tax=Aureicoccus marinus TaxID=754435 RepID=A0A2S7T4V9_9FLAO|nr:exonuclease domain-containing protein [Aureicoccus marinus]PQJ14486.1 hypothetical protein BST99_00820 [Aureicoccus marinus]
MPRYCIVDIETTNGRLRGNKVTEIALFLWEDGKCIAGYESLVQPEIPIPSFIEGLTGISDEMVADAPLFSDIAEEVRSYLEGAVFVAHSVQFDYHVLKAEFEALGQEFLYPKLCTVRLSRSLVPGLNSYSLGKLCSSLGIPLSNRHRAGGDARATGLLFEYLLALPKGPGTIERFLNRRSREASLPPGIEAKEIQALPEAPGIYYFHNAQNEIIYVGKAVNIRKRVWSHFYSKTAKSQKIRKEIASVHFRLSGSEMLALLIESGAIQEHWPKFNRAQKRRNQSYALFTYEDRQGLKHLAYDQENRVPSILLRLPSAKHCESLLTELCERSSGCPRYYHLLRGAKNCSGHALGQCQGNCSAAKDAVQHNQKIQESLNWLQENQEDQIVLLPGRTEEEKAFVFIENGQYRGYGFVPEDQGYACWEDLEPYLVPCRNTPETQNILLSFLLRPDKQIKNVGNSLNISG